MSQKKIEQTAADIFLSYVGLLASRNAYAPGDNFEFDLWEEMSARAPSLISQDEQQEISFLVQTCKKWVTYNPETRMFSLIEMSDWLDMLDVR